MRQARIIRNVHLGIKSLMLHKMRSFLTILGVVCGVGSVVAMLAVGEGGSRDLLEQIRKLGSNNIILETVKPMEEEAETSGSTRRRENVYGLTRVVGYFSRIDNWNLSKIGELEDRHAGNYTLAHA